MATRDRTEDFREAVRTIALKQGFNEVKMAKVIESLMLRRPQQKSPFTQAAHKTLESIRTLQIFVVNHKKDYMVRHRTVEHDLDDIERQVGVLVEACREQIEILKRSIESKERKGLIATWLGVQGDVANADVVAHQHGVVLILSQRLQSIASLLDQLRTARFREVIDRTMSRRMRHRRSNLKHPETPISNDPKDIEVIQRNALVGPKGIQKQILDEETQALQVELTNLLGTVQETERNMLEISALSNLFSTNVSHQTQQIKHLYEQAVEATQNFGTGNKELTKAIQHKGGGRPFLLRFLFIVVLILSILFLDWYQ
jgi:syntaxin 18